MKNLLTDLPHELQNKIWGMYVANLIRYLKYKDKIYKRLNAKRLERQMILLAFTLWPEGNMYIPHYMMKRSRTNTTFDPHAYDDVEPYASKKLNLESGCIDIERAEQNREQNFSHSYFRFRDLMEGYVSSERETNDTYLYLDIS